MQTASSAAAVFDADFRNFLTGEYHLGQFGIIQTWLKLNLSVVQNILEVIVTLHQCDQIGQIIFQHLAIYISENLPNGIQNLPKLVQNISK